MSPVIASARPYTYILCTPSMYFGSWLWDVINGCPLIKSQSQDPQYSAVGLYLTPFTSSRRDVCPPRTEFCLDKLNKKKLKQSFQFKYLGHWVNKPIKVDMGLKVNEYGILTVKSNILICAFSRCIVDLKIILWTYWLSFYTCSLLIAYTEKCVQLPTCPLE